MNKLRIVVISVLALVFASTAMAAHVLKFNDNPNHSALLQIQVVGNSLQYDLQPGSLAPGTPENLWISYSSNDTGNQFKIPVTIDATGGLEVVVPFATVYGSASPPVVGTPGTVEFDLTVPGSLGTLGQYVVLPDGKNAFIYGKLKQT